MADEPARVGVLFVCHANMCRSPLAEGLFRHLATQRGVLERFEIDSAGVQAIEGCPPHELSRAIAAEHGFALSGEGRQLFREDLSRFDHVVVMDRSNYATLERLAAPSAFGSLANYKAQIRLLRAVANPRARGRDLDVPDPIGGGPARYAEVYTILREACSALLDELTPR